MSLLNCLTGRFAKKKRTWDVPGAGIFEYYKDKDDEYWMVEHPVMALPDGFDMGFIEGGIDGPRPEALKTFLAFARQPFRLAGLVGEKVLAAVRPHFPGIDRRLFEQEFFLKSLSVTDENTFEFGFHSRSKDIFVEAFVRNGVVTETCVDEGCCTV